jgi:hypothetical protein
MCFDYIHLFETFKSDPPLPQRQLTNNQPTLKSTEFLCLHCLLLADPGGSLLSGIAFPTYWARQSTYPFPALTNSSNN